MSSTHDRHVEDLFDQVVDEPQTRRQKLPDALRQLEPAVVQEVEGLLAVDPHRHRVLEQDGEDLVRRLLAGGVAHSVPPRIGRYVVQQHLGEGGMGAVYLARREPLGDLVALKLLRDPWGSPARRRRFASEQRLLARLNHRHIARLYDAGFEGETPWFAMEYVQGEPIVAYCRMHVVSLRDRLRLFRAACEAVSYAHRNLIVHLDLKPSNVLVSTEGEVKLVDFGIARQLSPNGGTEKTATVRRWLSLGYAAPEQLRGGPLDVQADVYSLGVILYELLAGTRPRDFDEVAFTEPAECLAADPPRVSAAARTGKQGVHASKSAWRDLDLICETAMRADKAERYRSVDALIADIDSFLDDRPLAARHTRTSAYRIGKFLRRHRRPIAAAAVAAAVIAMVVAALSIRLVDARNRTVASEARVQSIHALMLNLFAGDDQAAGPADGLRLSRCSIAVRAKPTRSETNPRFRPSCGTRSARCT